MSTSVIITIIVCVTLTVLSGLSTLDKYIEAKYNNKESEVKDDEEVNEVSSS